MHIGVQCHLHMYHLCACEDTGLCTHRLPLCTAPQYILLTSSHTWARTQEYTHMHTYMLSDTLGSRLWRTGGPAAAAPVQLWRSVASWECRLRAARASEFLREAGKLNFYVKYPDF